MKLNNNISKISALSLAMLFLVCLTYFGCKKDISSDNLVRLDPTNTLAEFINKASAPNDGNIVFQIQDNVIPRVLDKNINNPFLNFSAGFYVNKSQANLKLVGTLTVDGKQITPKGLGYSFLEFGTTTPDAVWLKSLWGRKINIKAIKPTIALNSTASGDFSSFEFNTDLYLPSPLEIGGVTNNLTDFQFNSSGESISWNPDVNNTTGKIVIMVMYDAGANNNPTGNDEVLILKEVPDNGNYTFTPEEINGLVVNTNVIVGIARGSYMTVTDTNNPSTNFLVSAVASSLMPMTIVR
jgi:hypothetical protein